MKVKVKRIVFALLLCMPTLLTPMNNDHKDDYHTSLMSILDTYPEAHRGTPSPIPAAAAPSPAHYVPIFLQQFSPLRTENSYVIPYQEDNEQSDPEDFFDIDELPKNDAPAAALAAHNLGITIETIDPLESTLVPKSFKSPSTEKMPAQSEEKIKCPKCDVFLSIKQNLETHILTQHTITRAYLCSKCREKFDNAQQLVEHLTKAHFRAPADAYKLKKDSASSREGWFSTKPMIDETPKVCGSVSSVKTIMCPVSGCNTSFRELSILKTHLLSLHTSLRLFVCPIPVCQKSFALVSNLHQHIVKHHPGIPFPPCSQKIKDAIDSALAPFLQSIPLPKRQAAALKKRKVVEEDLHLDLEQNDSENSFDLHEFLAGDLPNALSVDAVSRSTVPQAHPLEPLAFSLESQSSSKKRLAVKLAMPAPSKKHQDSPSDYIFNFKYQSWNIVRPTTEEKLECPVSKCTYNTKQYTYLKDHILREHTSLRPFICPKPECKKEFNTNSNLHTHAKKEHPGIQIPPPSQEVKDLVNKTLAPYLETFSRTKEQSDTLSSKGNNEN